MGASYFSLADLAVAGIAFDIAGAIILALSFSTKKPEEIRAEAPDKTETEMPMGEIKSNVPVQVDFPTKPLRDSLIRHRAEARLGLFLLVLGFVMQLLVYVFFSDAHITSNGQRGVAALLILVVALIAFVGVKKYVPWHEDRTRAKVDRAGNAA